MRASLVAGRGATIVTVRTVARHWAGIFALLSALGCDGSPSAPTSPSAPPSGPSIAAGTIFRLRSGETDQPVAGASITLSAQSSTGPFNAVYASDAAGQFVLDRTVLLSSTPLLEVLASGFLVRTTILRSDETTITLWPSASATGLNEDFSSTVAYSTSTCPAANTGASVLRRTPSSVRSVNVSFDSSIQDQAAATAHQQAIARLNDATGGLPAYQFVSGVAGGVSMVAEIDPNNATCSTGDGPLRATVVLTTANGEIMSGRLVYCSLGAARSAELVLHELGHTLGLYHSSSTADVMYCSTGRPLVFSSRERLLMRLARQRRAGNRWPDNDRSTSSPLSGRAIRTEVTTCQ
jgi:hypothetical protein